MKINNPFFQVFILFFCVYNLNFLQLQIFIWTRSFEATTWELIHSTVSQMNPNYIMTSALSSFSLFLFFSLFGNACQMRQESEHLRRGSHKLFAFASLIVLLLLWLLHRRRRRRRCTRVHSQHTPHSGGDGLKATVSIRGPRKESVDNLTWA